MKPLPQLLLLLLVLSQCVHGTMLFEQQQQLDDSSTLSASEHSLRALQQASDSPAAASAAADMLLIATTSSSSVFAAQAGSTCRITPQNRATLTVQCHSSCQTCTRGAAGTPRAQRQCRCCKPGFFLAAGSTAAACTPCPAGQVGPLFGQTACRKCPRNLLSLKAGSRVCDGCPAGHGYVTVPVKLANGTTADLAACRQCLPGSIAPGGPLASTFCQACGQGRTTLPLPTPRTECAACRPGFGGKSCSPCKAGTYSRGGPADDVTGACIACPPGTTSSDGAAGPPRE